MRSPFFREALILDNLQSHRIDGRKRRNMAIRIVPDKDEPSAAVEIPLEKALPDYDLEQMAQPTPRDVDGILVSQGFRDLVDDARGVLTEILSGSGLEITQFTGAICPDHEQAYRPGLWIVLKDTKASKQSQLSGEAQERVRRAATDLSKKLQLD